MAKEQEEAKKSGRELYIERVKAKYPEREWVDDEALFAQANEDYDASEQELAIYKEREKELSDMFAANPRNAAIFMDMKEGGDLLVSLVRKYGDDFKAALDDPEMLDKLAEANKEYAERVAENEAYEAEYQQNMGETLKTIEAVQAETGMSDEEVDDVIGFLVGIMKDAIVGKFTKESLIMAQKALNHDADVAEAAHEGEILGKNSKIKEALRTKKSGDGTPQLGSKTAGVEKAERDLGALGRGYGARSIWEAGGERRTKRGR